MFCRIWPWHLFLHDCQWNLCLMHWLSLLGWPKKASIFSRMIRQQLNRFQGAFSLILYCQIFFMGLGWVNEYDYHKKYEVLTIGLSHRPTSHQVPCLCLGNTSCRNQSAFNCIIVFIEKKIEEKLVVEEANGSYIDYKNLACLLIIKLHQESFHTLFRFRFCLVCHFK